jgi:hypothetical protein
MKATIQIKCSENKICTVTGTVMQENDNFIKIATAEADQGEWFAKKSTCVNLLNKEDSK